MPRQGHSRKHWFISRSAYVVGVTVHAGGGRAGSRTNDCVRCQGAERKVKRVAEKNESTVFSGRYNASVAAPPPGSKGVAVARRANGKR